MINTIGRPNKPWWTEPKNDVNKNLYDTVVALNSIQTGRMEKNLRSLQLYGNADIMGAAPYNYTFTVAAALNMPENRVKFNVVASTCDTVCAKISKMKARVEFLTSGGDYSLKKQAKQLTKFIDGMFYQNRIYKMHQTGFRDSTILDIGALKHYIKDGKIVSERVLGLELFCDPADAMYGSPTHLYQVKYWERDRLIEMYPKFKEEIMASSSSFDRSTRQDVTMSKYCAVIEAWHLPIGGEPGRHSIIVEKATLLDEKYNRDYFPFTFFTWAPPVTGFWGQALAERLTGNQIEINKMLRIIQKSFHLGSAFKVFLEYGSRVAKEHINNDIGSIVYYAGNKPEFYVPQTVHPEYFNHLNWLIQKSYEEAGISVSSATSRKPAGLESGVAIREYNDIETERFAIVSQAYEASFLETARQYIDLAKELAEEGVDIEVNAKTKKTLEPIKWSDVAMRENEYIMQMFPVSMLPHEPAGRLAFIQDLMNGGFVPREYALSLLDFPDVERFVKLENAALDDIEHVISEILDKGINGFTAPEPFQNLQLGIDTMHSAYLEAKNNGVSEDKLDLMRKWIAMAQKMLAMAAAPQQPDAQPQAAQQAPTAEGASVAQPSQQQLPQG